MQIQDMTENLFNKEMQRLLSDIEISLNKFKKAGQVTFKPTPKGGLPFPFAVEIQKLWQYAIGEGKKPANMQAIINDLEALLWGTVAGNAPSTPNSWHNEPLGFMVKLVLTREKLDAGADLNGAELADLSGFTLSRITQICRSGKMEGASQTTTRSKNSRPQWAIPATTARKFIKKQGRK